MIAPLYLTQDEEQAVCQAYLDGQRVRHIAKRSRFGHSTVYKVLAKNNVPKRPRGSKRRKEGTTKRDDFESRARQSTLNLVQRMREYQPGSYA